jgi:hypothetical protein
MGFQTTRMKKLIEQDRFLLSTYDELISQSITEEEALHYMFLVYVQSEPILLNAYNHLTIKTKDS